jgi:hypothetical protein
MTITDIMNHMLMNKQTSNQTTFSVQPMYSTCHMLVTYINNLSIVPANAVSQLLFNIVKNTSSLNPRSGCMTLNGV